MSYIIKNLTKERYVKNKSPGGRSVGFKDCRKFKNFNLAKEVFDWLEKNSKDSFSIEQLKNRNNLSKGRDYVLRFGKHKGKKIDKVPVAYLDWLHGEPWFRDEYPTVYKTVCDMLLENIEQGSLSRVARDKVSVEQFASSHIKSFTSFEEYWKERQETVGGEEFPSLLSEEEWFDMFIGWQSPSDKE